MRVPFYWSKVEYSRTFSSPAAQIKCSCWGWSDVSEEEARAHAQERARRAQLGQGKNRSLGSDDYDLYQERPLREPVMERLYQPEGEQFAAITRNRYGSLVLNTARVMFVDVDLPKKKSGFLAFFSRQKREAERLARHEKVITRIVDWSQSHPDHAFRLYQTAAGYRLLFTSRLYEPLSEEVDRIFRGLGADSLYRLLTSKQACFRARISPKYWRLPNMLRYAPPHFDRDLYLSASQEWIDRYDQDCGGYRVCTLTETFGPPHEMLPEVAAVVALHDQRTGCEQENAQLA